MSESPTPLTADAEAILRQMSGDGIGDRLAREALAEIDRLRATCERLREERDALRTWQPMETAPRDRTILLAGENWTSTGAWCVDSWVSGEFDVQPTHWMPLPPAPQEQT